jgi:hypothetical protein
MQLDLVKKAAVVVNLCRQWLTHLGWVTALGKETLSHCKDPLLSHHQDFLETLYGVVLAHHEYIAANGHTSGHNMFSH